MCILTNKKFEHEKTPNPKEFLIFDANFESANIDLVVRVRIITKFLLFLDQRKRL